MSSHSPSEGVWSKERAQQWAERHGWLVGANYLPSTAVNALEMWQRDTFDQATIMRELDWAAELGFNSLRVFLHDLVWRDDRDGLIERMEIFLKIAAERGIGTMLVFFDSCWHPFPRSGPQRRPEHGVHNSFWVQSPGVPALRDSVRFAKLEYYVADVVGYFRDDERVHVWDLWNEPDNANMNSRGSRDLGAAKGDLVAPLLEQAFAWARVARPTQPLTSGLWIGDWHDEKKLKPCWQVQLRNSDVISFHDYQPLTKFCTRADSLKKYGRPLLCTEYMARGTGSTFEAIMPLLKQDRIAAYNWGFVAGKSQTYLPWDSWQQPYEEEPELWFHDIVRADGSAYRPAEVALIKTLTGKTPAPDCDHPLA